MKQATTETEEAIAQAELESAPTDLPGPPARANWMERLPAVAAVSAGGFLGANARYLIGSWVAARAGEAFPWGTLLINVSGSLVLGFYLTLATELFASRPTTRLFVATGFLGAFTTFSTFSYEVVQLLTRGDVLPAVAYVAGSLVLGLIAAAAGMVAAHGF